MKTNRNDYSIFDKHFMCIGDPITQTIIRMIIEDRKYDIPDWFYVYITDEILLSVIFNYNKIALDLYRTNNELVNVRKNYRTFLETCISKNVIQSYKFIAVTLYGAKILKFAWFINPDKLYSSLKGTIFDEDNRNLEKNQVVELIRMYVRMNDGEIPFPYIKLYLESVYDASQRIYDKGIFIREKIKKVKGSTNLANHLDSLIDYMMSCKDFPINKLFSTIWKKYSHVLTRHESDMKAKVNAGHINLVYYWIKGINYIPENASLVELYNYATHPALPPITSRPPIPESYARAIRSILKRTNKRDDIKNADDCYIKPIQRYIIHQVKRDINNVHAIFWHLDICDRRAVVDVFKRAPGKLKNFLYFYDCTKYVPSKEEFKKYIQCGGDYYSVKVVNVAISPAEYVETILTLMIHKLK